MKATSLTFVNFQRENGQEIDPAAMAFHLDAPENAAHGRGKDSLAVYLVISGNANDTQFSAPTMQKTISNAFFQFQGPLTSALKNAVSAVNTLLMDANMRSTSKGAYRFGCMVLCCFQADKVTIVQAGPTRVYKLGVDTREFFDPLLAGKGLGISPAAKMYFAQAPFAQNDQLVVTLEQPDGWKQVIEKLPDGTPAEVIRQRLYAATREDVAGCIVCFGQPSVSAVETVRPQPQAEDVKPVSEEKNDIGDCPPRPTRQTHRDRHQPNRPSRKQPVPMPSFNLQGFFSGGLGLLRSSRSFYHRSIQFVERNIFRVIPEGEMENPVSLASQRIGLVTALSLPVLVLILAQMVYSNVGFDDRYNEYVSLARADIARAISVPDPIAKRGDLIATLDRLEKAEQSSGQLDSDALQLREQAGMLLDELDKVQRLIYQPALTKPLAAGAITSKMVASNSDLFLLDATGNDVTRYVFNGASYDQDPGFKCKSGEYLDGEGQPIKIGRLIDILPLSPTAQNGAILLGVDESLHLLYCQATGAPTSSELAVPDLGIKQVSFITMYEDTLFVLDKLGRSVYMYYGNGSSQFNSAPVFAFSDQVPAGLSTAVNLVVGSDSISFLSDDGHVTACQFSHAAGVASACEETITFTDTRPGYSSGPRLSDAIFNQMAITQQPNPAILFLDQVNQAVFVFSPNNFELQKELRAPIGENGQLPVGKPVSMFASSPNKNLFLLIENQVYFAALK